MPLVAAVERVRPAPLEQLAETEAPEFLVAWEALEPLEPPALPARLVPLAELVVPRELRAALVPQALKEASGWTHRMHPGTILLLAPR